MSEETDALPLYRGVLSEDAPNLLKLQQLSLQGVRRLLKVMHGHLINYIQTEIN